MNIEIRWYIQLGVVEWEEKNSTKHTEFQGSHSRLPAYILTKRFVYPQVN